MGRRRHPSLRSWLLVAVSVVSLWPVDSARAGNGQKQVLVLYATRRDAQIVTVGDRELPRILEGGLPGGLDYYSEFIDRARFPRDDYQSGFRDFLRLKYRGQQFDLVIAMGDMPLEFVEENRWALFPETPVVFFSNRPSLRRPANSTGVTSVLDLHSTLALAAALQPDVRQLFVVSGAGEANKEFEAAARKQLQPFDRRFSITYLSGLPTKDLEARLASLPAHSIVYYLVVDQDGAQQNFHPLDYLDRVTAASNAPVYCWVDSAMDRGIVGGSLKDQVAQTRAMGALALKVLHGTPADAIPLATPDLNVSEVDWRQLRRWGISESRVPAGTIVSYREPSVWDRYKLYILGALTALVAQTALIAGLLLQGARRRKAEARVRAREADLRASYRRIRDLGGRLLSAQDAERSRIARELHDDIGQQLMLLTIDLDLLGNGGRHDAATLARGALGRAHGIANSLRDLSHRLHPAKLRLIGLVPALASLRREATSADMAVTFTHENVPAVIAPDVTLCLYRVAQEALHNAAKYSQARAVSMNLNGGSGGLVLKVTDDGVGFNVEAVIDRGLGLVSMRERVEALGGALDIRSSPGAGASLAAVVPCQGAAPAANATPEFERI